MIIKKSIKPNSNICDCCNKTYSDTIMKHYEIGAIKYFTLCKDCENLLNKISSVDTVKNVLGSDNKIYY